MLRLASWMSNQISIHRGDAQTSPQITALSRAKSKLTKNSVYYSLDLEVIVPDCWAVQQTEPTISSV